MPAVIQYDGYAKCESAASYNELLDRFYAERDRCARLRGISDDLLKLLNNIKASEAVIYLGGAIARSHSVFDSSYP